MQIVAKSDRLLTLDLVYREELSRSNRHQNRGKLIVHAEESVSSKTTIEMSLRCLDLEYKDLFSKSVGTAYFSISLDYLFQRILCQMEMVHDFGSCSELSSRTLFW